MQGFHGRPRQQASAFGALLRRCFFFGQICQFTAADRSPLVLFVDMQLCSKPAHGSVENAGSKRQSTNTQWKNLGLPLFRTKRHSRNNSAWNSWSTANSNVLLSISLRTMHLSVDRLHNTRSQCQESAKWHVCYSRIHRC